MSARGPQSLHSPSPLPHSSGSAAAQDKKLHQLSAPLRNSIAADEPDYAPLSAGGGGSAGGSSSWDENEVARQMALLTEERNFLRKYVSRCEHELKAYQLQYPELVGGAAAAARQGELVNELSGAVDELPPWIGQAKYMSPLLVAYEARIEEITQKSQEQMHDFAALKQQYDELFARNSAAEAELESNIKNLLHHMDDKKGVAGKAGGPLDEDEVAELHEQVQLYREQLDIVQSQKLELEAEVTKAHASMGELRAERDNFWSGEVKKAQAAVATVKQERDRLAHSAATLQQTQLDLSSLQKEHAALQKKYLQSQSGQEALEHDLERMTEKERSSSASLVHAERDLESLLKTLQGMERELDEARAREVAAVKRDSDSVAKVEAMRLEKSQAQLREQSLARDLARLEERALFQLTQAHKQAEEEVAALYQRSKESEEKLQGELAALSLVVAELEAQKDSLQRSTSHAQSQADRVVGAMQAELLGLKSSLSSAQSQVQELQQNSEAHLAKLRRAEAELGRMQEFGAKERAQAHEASHALKLKNESLTLANQNLHVQVARLSEAVARMEKESSEQRRTSEGLIGRLQAQLLDSESSRKQSVDELKQRLEEAYRLHEVSEARTAELSASQDVLSSKWREENKHVRAHLSKLLTEEKSVSAGLHKRVAELEARCQQLVRERDQAMSFETAYEQSKKSAESTAAELGQRVQLLSAELSAYAAREPEYMLAAKTMQGKLDRAEIEVKRLTRQYEAAIKKVHFIESTSQQPHHAAPLQQPTISSVNTGRSSGNAAGSYAPIPFAQSLLPPSFKSSA